MTPDPAKQLADIGRRVLRIVQPLVKPPGFDRTPNAYEKLLLDPMNVLAGTCNELLVRTDTTPATAEHDGTSGEPGSDLLPDSNVRAPSLFPRAVAVVPTARTPRDVDAPHAGHWRESNLIASSDTPLSSPGRPPDREQIRRAVEVPLVPFLDEPATRLGDTVRSSDRSRRPSDRGSVPHGVPDSGGQPLADRSSSNVRDSSAETSLGGHDPVQTSPRREEPRRDGRPGPWHANTHENADTREKPDSMRGSTKASATGANPREGVRLAASPSRFAAMLREHVAVPDAEGLFMMAQDGGAGFPGRTEHDGRSTDPVDEPERMRPDGRIDVEEIMERLADELETGFVRTYGSSGR